MILHQKFIQTIVGWISKGCIITVRTGNEWPVPQKQSCVLPKRSVMTCSQRLCSWALLGLSAILSFSKFLLTQRGAKWRAHLISRKLISSKIHLLEFTHRAGRIQCKSCFWNIFLKLPYFLQVVNKLILIVGNIHVYLPRYVQHTYTKPCASTCVCVFWTLNFHSGFFVFLLLSFWKGFLICF